MTTPTAPERPRVRVPFWDNARFLCVSLVVIGHAIQRLTADSDNALIVYLFVYAFHMPAFAIISGYFSKPGAPGERQMRKVITDIVVPYVIMESIWTLVKWLAKGSTDVNPTQPSWTLWFLLALGIFRLVLPYLSLLRWPLLWAVVLSVGVGYFSNVDSTFSLSRTIGILPFFVLGWKLKEWGLVELWRGAERLLWWVRAGAVATFGVWLICVVVFIDQFRAMKLQQWFFYDDSYESLGGDPWWSGVLRLGFILLAVVLSAAFFALVPRSDTWMTRLGQATMYVYLLHSFVLYPLRETGLLQGEHASGAWLGGMILAGAAISIVLASDPVRRFFRPIIEPRPHWLFLRDDALPRRESRTDPTGARRR